MVFLFNNFLEKVNDTLCLTKLSRLNFVACDAQYRNF